MITDSKVNRCLYCYEELPDGITEHYHSKCAKRLFGNPHAPLLPYTRDNIEELALHILESNTSITGVETLK